MPICVILYRLRVPRGARTAVKDHGGGELASVPGEAREGRPEVFVRDGVSSLEAPQLGVEGEPHHYVPAKVVPGARSQRPAASDTRHATCNTQHARVRVFRSTRLSNCLSEVPPSLDSKIALVFSMQGLVLGGAGRPTSKRAGTRTEQRLVVCASG